MNNRILAMLLAIIMIVSIVPVNAFAAESAGCTHAATDRTKVDAKPATCTEDGTIEYYLCKCTTWFADSSSTVPLKPEDVIVPAGHKDENQDYNCDSCGVLLEHAHLDDNDNGTCDVTNCKAHVHVMEQIVAKEATCTDRGISMTYYKCKVTDCQKAYRDIEGKDEIRESDYILLPEHNMTAKEAVAAECEKYGQIAYFYCEDCKQPFADKDGKTALTWNKVVIPALTHEYDYTEREYGNNSHDAKCKKCGKETYGVCEDTADHNHVCDKCGGLLLHTDNDVTTAPKNPATCTEPGMADHYVCVTVNCGRLFVKEAGVYVNVEQEDIAEIPATGHAPSDYIYHDEDFHWQLCNNGCDEILNKVAHTPGEWKLYPSNNDQHYRLCTVCNETLAPVDHVYTYTAQEYGEDWHRSDCVDCEYYKTPGCVDKDGDHKCDDCLAVMAKVHESGLTYVAEVPAKCGVEGVKAHYKCDDCGVLFSGSNGDRIVTTDELKIDALEHQLSGWMSDGTAHWKECIRYGCPAELEYAEHTPGVCHEYPTDKSKHFEQCTVCVRSLNIRDHEYTYTSNENGISHKAECKECGKIRETASCYDKDKNCYCDACGGLMKHELAPLSTVKQDPKCGVVGYKEHYKCNTCQNIFDINCNVITLESVTIPALQHKWWPKGLDLTGTLHTEMCEYCKVISFKSHFDNTGDCMCDYAGCTEAAHEHTIVHVAEKAATCTEEGHQEYWKYAECGKEFADAACTQPLTQKVIYGKTSHNATGWTPTEDGTAHEQKCRTCGEVLATEEHDFSTEAPYCADCNMPEGLEFVPEVPATCTVRGVKAHYKSSITQRKYWDAAGTRYISNVNELVIDLQPHAWEVVTSDGVNHVIGCENCTAEYTEACESKDTNCACDVCGILQPGHTMTYVEPVAATCTKNGIIASWYCAKCDKYFDAETLEYLPTVIAPALGHRVTGNWRNDVTENAHSKYCIRCEVKITEEHELEAYDLYSGNLHEWRCSVCTYKKSETHNYNGDSICDDCEHDTAKTVDVSAMDNDRVTVKVETDDEDDTVQEKKASFWKGFVDKIKPSYVGESQSPSAPSTSVNNPLPNGSGVSSSSTGTSQTTTATNPSAFDAVIDVLWGLLNALGNMLGL